MSFTVTLRHGLPYLYAELAGPAMLGDLMGAAALVATAAAAAGERRALLNLLGSQLPLTFTQHLQLGTFVAETFKSFERVATAVAPEYRSGTSERAARLQGVALRAFTDLESARAWLVS